MSKILAVEYKYYIDGPRDYNGGVHQIWGRGVWTLRQTRFLGREDARDVCVVGTSLDQLWKTIPDEYKKYIDSDEKPIECDQCHRLVLPSQAVLAGAGEDHPPLHKRCKAAWTWDDLDELDKEPMGF